ncbi:hypothetical protein [Providencia alcalifaciens]|uniref:hypothetical protein n=1 Tax=Providencia alcalifaciens TaxID=126385 RepID=UPI00044F52CC|nr:hypothetical protein [Providencia alcalifaciens]EUC97265.1 hypothetical protein HMPREF1567_1759 [Providencia alcalifaciens PAL-2]
MDKSKQQFEAFINDGDFPWLKASIPIMWMVWKASRESLINNLEPVGYINPVGQLCIKRKLNAVIKPNKESNSIPLYRLDK